MTERETLTRKVGEEHKKVLAVKGEMNQLEATLPMCAARVTQSHPVLGGDAGGCGGAADRAKLTD